MKRFSPAPVVNAKLADLLNGEPNPKEPLAEAQGQAIATFMFGTADQLTKCGRPVILACGHYTMTKAVHVAGCPRCGEMIRSGYDYDAFRHLGHPDDFHWPGDPFRELHEKDRTEPGARYAPI